MVCKNSGIYGFLRPPWVLIAYTICPPGNSKTIRACHSDPKYNEHMYINIQIKLSLYFGTTYSRPWLAPTAEVYETRGLCNANELLIEMILID